MRLTCFSHGFVREPKWTQAASGPFAAAKYRRAAAVGIDAVDIGLVRADHPVDMDQTLVAALRGDLFRRKVAAIDKTFGIALAERDMAGGVFVEQRVEEQQS